MQGLHGERGLDGINDFFFPFTFNYSCICIYYGKEFACGGYSVDIDLMDSYIGVEIGVG